MAKVQFVIESVQQGDGFKVAVKGAEGLVDAQNRVKSSFESMSSTLSQGFGIGAGFGIATKAAELFVGAVRAVPDAVLAAVSSVMKLGGELTDMSAKTGIGIEALQKLKFAGELGGVGMETIVRSVEKMKVALVNAPEKFEKLGLSAQALIAMNPGDAFQKVATAVAAIENPAMRSAAAVSLLGKTGADINQFAQEMANAAIDADRLGFVMSSETAAAADELGDSLTTLSKTADGFVQNLASIIVESPAVVGAVQDITEVIGALSVAMRENKPAIVAVSDQFLEWGKTLPFVGGLIRDVTSSLNALRIAALAVPPALPALGKQTKLSTAADPAQLNENRLIREGIKLAEEQIRADAKRVTAGIAAAKRLAQENERAAEAVVKSAEKAAEAWRKFNLEMELRTIRSTGEMFKAHEDLAKKRAALYEKEFLKELEHIVKLRDASAKFELDRTLLAASGADRRMLLIRREFDADVKSLGDRTKSNAQFWDQAYENAAGLYFDRIKEESEETSREMMQAFGDAARSIGAMFGETGATIGNLVGTFASLRNAPAFQASAQGAATAASGLMAARENIAINARRRVERTGSTEGAGRAGAMEGAVAGAEAGGNFGWVGAIAGAVGGGIGGWINASRNASEAAKKLRNDTAELREELVRTNGGFANLSSVARSAGYNLQVLMDARTPGAFNQAMEGLNRAIEAQGKRIDGLGVATAGLTLRTAAFVSQLESGAVAGDQMQAGFDRMGTFAMAAFGGLVKETGDVIGALQQMGPALASLQEAQQQFGLEGSAAVNKLLAIRDVVAANEDVAQSIQGLNMMMQGFADGGVMTADLFRAIGTDAASQFQILKDRGVEANDALVLMQPTLQELWEGQQRFGNITDAATLSMLQQAEAQGLVGANMQSVNEKMLQVLLSIGEALGATIPAGIANMNTSLGTIPPTLGAIADASGTTATTIAGQWTTGASDVTASMSGMATAVSGQFGMMGERSGSVADNVMGHWNETHNTVSADMGTLRDSTVQDFEVMGYTGIQTGDYVGIAWGGAVLDLGVHIDGMVPKVVSGFELMADGSTDQANRVADAVGGILGGLQAIPGAAQQAGQAIGNMPAGPGGGGPTGNPGGGEPPPPPTFASGGVINAGSGTMASLHGVEAVIPAEGLEGFARVLASHLQGAGGGLSTSATFNIDASTLNPRELVQLLMRELRNNTGASKALMNEMNRGRA